MACADCNQGCNCRIIAGTGATVTGSGLPADPYVVGTSGPVSPDWTPAVAEAWSTATIDLSALDEPTTIEASLTANVTSITLPSWASTVSGDITVLVTNTGAFTIVWPGLTAGGAAIGTTAGAGSMDLVRLTWTGLQWVARLLAADLS